MMKKRIIKLFIVLGGIFFPNNFFAQKIFKEFVNIDSLQCFEKFYPFYYHLENEFFINDILINEFKVGMSKNKSTTFWVGKDSKNIYYSLEISNDRHDIVRKKELFLNNSSKLLISNKRLNLKFKKKSFISQNSGFIYTYAISNQSSLRKIFDNRYSNFSIIFSEKKGVEISFDYTDENIDTIYGGCDKL